MSHFLQENWTDYQLSIIPTITQKGLGQKVMHITNHRWGIPMVVLGIPDISCYIILSDP